MDVENNHSMPLIPRPAKSTPRIAMLAAAAPSAEWLPSKEPEKSSCADWPGRPGPKPEKEKVSRLHKIRRWIYEMRRNME